MLATMPEAAVEDFPMASRPVSEMRNRWFLCQTFSGKEFQFTRWLRKHLGEDGGFFLPIIAERRGQRQVRFKRYVFLNGDSWRDAADYYRRLSDECRLTISPMSAKYQPILQDELENLYAALMVDPSLGICAAFRNGQKVRICKGALRGIRGVVDYIGDDNSVYLNCAILGEATPVRNVPASHLEIDDGGF